MKGGLSVIDYVLRAVITPKIGEPIKMAQTLDVKRAIYPSDQPRHSIRIFPPTNLTANCELPPVIHPIGETNISMRMDGVVKRNSETKTQTQWKLKRLTWRLDETQKTISPACAKHAAKLGNTDDAKKGMAHSDTRTIGTDEMKSGWKADYNSPDGSIELEFPFGIRGDSKPICDMKAEDGTEVVHILIVEMIVAEEFAPIKKPTQVTPTGAARVLRMHFNITVTERSGLGISWDEEQPPLYENVPASPPTYGNSELYEGDAIPNYEDLTPLTAAESPMPAPIPDRTNGEGGSRSLGMEDLTLEP
jgi:arrestin-related trafficking adapter 1